VLQSPEGGFLSVGNRRFRIRRSVTPPLTPVSVRPLEGVPVTMPANMLTERIPPRARSSRFSTLPAATDKITISRNVLFGLCLATFAFGILTTLAIDHMHARASEAPAARDLEPVVLQTTPIEPAARPTPATAVAAPQPSSFPSSSASPPQPAAADAVVVQLPSVAEKSGEKSPGKLLAHLPAPPPSRGARLIAAAPVRATPATPHPRTSTTLQSDSSSTGTEAAPDEGPAMPSPTKKKWVDPFDQ
jgi:predicted outer membrane lipoprotein